MSSYQNLRRLKRKDFRTLSFVNRLKSLVLPLTNEKVAIMIVLTGLTVAAFGSGYNGTVNTVFQNVINRVDSRGAGSAP